MLILVGLALLVSCTRGGEGPSATDSPPESTTTAPSTTTTVVSDLALEAFRTCLADLGIEIEEIPLDATGHPRLDLVLATLDFTDPATSDAVSTCAENLETGALDIAGDDQLHQAVLEQLQGFSQCMGDAGIEDFPDPVPGFVGVGPPFPLAEIPYGDPGFADAVRFCRQALLDALSGRSTSD